MDKSQRQLIDTYFRKRQMAVVHVSTYSYPYKDYEAMFMVENGMDTSKLSPDQIMKAINKNPENVTKVDLSRLGEQETYQIMMKYPELRPRMQIEKIRSPRLISQLMTQYPDLIPRFRYNNFSGEMLKTILDRHPQYVDQVLATASPLAFRQVMATNPQLLKKSDFTYRKDQESLSFLLDKRPELAPKLDLTNFTNPQLISVLLMKQPQLSKYFPWFTGGAKSFKDMDLSQYGIKATPTGKKK